MASWRDNLRPASFRGVGFLFDDGDMSGGRRLQVNEYPQRDIPFVEDMGRKARAISLNVFVLGDDYAAQRDDLLAALETAGSGELIHPRLGALIVYAGDYRYSESSTEGRMCRFSLSFTETGELTFPSSETNHSASAADLSEQLEEGEATDFANDLDLSSPELEASALAQMTENISSAIELVGFGIELANELVVLINNPQLLVQRYFAAYQPELLGLWNSGSAVYRRLNGLLKSMQKTRYPVTKAMPSTTPNQLALARNAQAIDRLHRSAMLASASQVAAGLDQVRAPIQSGVKSSSATVVVWQDAEDLRKQIIQQVDAEEAHGATYEPRRFVLAALRANTVQGIKSAQRNAVRLVEVTPPEVEPALVTAYRLYGDALRSDEIVARNQLMHPGFVPMRVLRVLEK